MKWKTEINMLINSHDFIHSLNKTEKITNHYTKKTLFGKCVYNGFKIGTTIN